MRNPSYFHRGGEVPLIGQPIYTYLEAIAARQPETEALVSLPQEIRWTYAQLFSEVDRLAKGLLALGVDRGDRVGVWATNNAEWFLLQLATAHVGAVLVTINPAYRGAELEHALRAARVGYLFLMPAFRSSQYVEIVRRLCPEAESQAATELRVSRLPELRRLIVFDPDAEAADRPAPGFTTWEEVLEGAASVSDRALAEREAELDADDPINIQFTSGTTGFPKPVVLTHHNILNNGFFIGEALALTSQDRVCVPVPFYHCFGMVISNLGNLSHGATTIIPSPHFNAAATLAAVDQERCTVLHGVPTMFVAEFERPDFADFDLSRLRTGVMAGAPCPPELLNQVIDRMGCHEIRIAYGQTEASPVTHITRRDDSFENRTRTVGRNTPHSEVKVIDPATGAVLPIGEPGEVCFRGYQVMRGYYEQREATREAIDAGGWLHSGDLGVMDESGYLRITGRLKEMVIRGGENIYPAEIEAYLMAHPKVVQAEVFGVADERFGEEVGAWIQLREESVV